jgi:hypothetical protein
MARRPSLDPRSNPLAQERPRGDRLPTQRGNSRRPYRAFQPHTPSAASIIPQATPSAGSRSRLAVRLAGRPRPSHASACPTPSRGVRDGRRSRSAAWGSPSPVVPPRSNYSAAAAQQRRGAGRPGRHRRTAQSESEPVPTSIRTRTHAPGVHSTGLARPARVLPHGAIGPAPGPDRPTGHRRTAAPPHRPITPSRHHATATPRHRDTATPRHRDTATPRHRDTATPRRTTTHPRHRPPRHRPPRHRPPRHRPPLHGVAGPRADGPASPPRHLATSPPRHLASAPPRQRGQHGHHGRHGQHAALPLRDSAQAAPADARRPATGGSPTDARAPYFRLGAQGHRRGASAVGSVRSAVAPPSNRAGQPLISSGAVRSA